MSRAVAQQKTERGEDVGLTPSRDSRFKWEESLGVLRWLQEDIVDLPHTPVETKELESIKLPPKLSRPRAEGLGVHKDRGPFLDTCECTNGVTCAYCVQAKLSLWGRKEQEAKRSPINDLRERITKIGIRATAREFGVDHKTVSVWIKKGSVPSRYINDKGLVGNGGV